MQQQRGKRDRDVVDGVGSDNTTAVALPPLIMTMSPPPPPPDAGGAGHQQVAWAAAGGDHLAFGGEGGGVGLQLQQEEEEDEEVVPSTTGPQQVQQVKRPTRRKKTMADKPPPKPRQVKPISNKRVDVEIKKKLLWLETYGGRGKGRARKDSKYHLVAAEAKTFVAFMFHWHCGQFPVAMVCGDASFGRKLVVRWLSEQGRRYTAASFNAKIKHNLGDPVVSAALGNIIPFDNKRKVAIEGGANVEDGHVVVTRNSELYEFIRANVFLHKLDVVAALLRHVKLDHDAVRGCFHVALTFDRFACFLPTEDEEVKVAPIVTMLEPLVEPKERFMCAVSAGHLTYIHGTLASTPRAEDRQSLVDESRAVQVAALQGFVSILKLLLENGGDARQLLLIINDSPEKFVNKQQEIRALLEAVVAQEAAATAK